MPNKKLKVLIVATEVTPFASVGGLSQVMYFLPQALKKKDTDVRLFMPKFGLIDEKKFPTKIVVKDLKIPTGDKERTYLICNVKQLTDPKGPVIYFLENREYYELRANIYNYNDDHIRFALLSRGALEFLTKISWTPNVIHINDWHTSYLANYLRTTYKNVTQLKKVAVLLSMHNLYQGWFDFSRASDLDFDDGKGELASFFDDRLYKQNSLKRGIIYSDIVNTVSPTYAREILSPRYGQGLDNLLKEVRTKIYGILNGLDYEEFNPKTDKFIKKNYGLTSLETRVENKLDLQREFCLEKNPEVPILAISGRLDLQKGIDLVAKVIPYLLEEFKIQFIVMGGGEATFVDLFEKMETKYHGRVGTHLMPNFTLPRKIFAGGDIFLLPSRYEPGGITAIEAMRYGAIPIVRATGGLADSVEDYDPGKNTGTGFTFKKFHSYSFLTCIVRALEAYKNKKAWRAIMRRAMSKDFSWERVANSYLELYKKAINIRREQLKQNPHQAYRTDY